MGLGLAFSVGGHAFVFLGPVVVVGLGAWLLLVVAMESQVPGHARASADGSELVNDVTWNEVDVVVPETESGVADAIATKLVEFSLLHPLATLQRGQRSDNYCIALQSHL